jgi:transcription elongation factor GreB
MSKAFTRENDDAEEETAIARIALPAGVRNYLTGDGAEGLRRKLEALIAERRTLEQAAEDDGARMRVRKINARIQAITQRLAGAEIVSAADGVSGEVRFGMYVTVRGADGAEDEYRIVGVDETDFDRGWISWLSPLAKALLGRRVGETVRFQAPAGERTLHIQGLRV